MPNTTLICNATGVCEGEQLISNNEIYITEVKILKFDLTSDCVLSSACELGDYCDAIGMKVDCVQGASTTLICATNGTCQGV